MAATTVFRAIYYARDRRAFFRHVAGYTEKKLVFDLNPRQYRLDDVLADLRAAGLGRVELRPVLRPADGRASRGPSSGSRPRSSARARSPGSPSACASPTSSRRRRLSAEQRPEADVHRRAELAPIRVLRVEVVRRERRLDRHLDAPGAFGAGEQERRRHALVDGLHLRLGDVGERRLPVLADRDGADADGRLARHVASAPGDAGELDEREPGPSRDTS